MTTPLYQVYIRETDGAPMVEVAPHQYVNRIWLDDQRRSPEESRAAARRRVVAAINRARRIREREEKGND